MTYKKYVFNFIELVIFRILKGTFSKFECTTIQIPTIQVPSTQIRTIQIPTI